MKDNNLNTDFLSKKSFKFKEDSIILRKTNLKKTKSHQGDEFNEKIKKLVTNLKDT